MTRHLTTAAVAAALALPVFAAPAAAQDPIDFGETCADLIGNQRGTIDLSPLARIDYWTCQNSDTNSPPPS